MLSAQISMSAVWAAIARHSLCFSLIILLLLSGLPIGLHAQDQSITRLEQRVLQKIQLYLNKVLPRDSFSANVSIYAEPIAPSQRATLGDELLPGLGPFNGNYLSDGNTVLPVPPGLTAAPSAAQTQTGVRYRDFLIKDISVDVTVDETLPQLTLDAVQNALINQLDTAYPNIANVSLVPADFTRIRLAQQERLAQQTAAVVVPEPAAAAGAQPPIIISNIIPQAEPAQQEQAQPIIVQQPAEPAINQPPVIISNIIPEAAATSPAGDPVATSGSFLSSFMRESSLIWYGLLIFLAILFFALVLFGILIVALRQDTGGFTRRKQASQQPVIVETQPREQPKPIIIKNTPMPPANTAANANPENEDDEQEDLANIKAAAVAKKKNVSAHH